MKNGKTVLLVLVGLILAFIWGHSLMSVEQSGAESLQVVEMLKGAFSRVCGLLGLFAAFLDETLQLFSGRGSMVADVWLDFAGVVCGVAAVAAGIWIWERGMKK